MRPSFRYLFFSISRFRFLSVDSKNCVNKVTFFHYNNRCVHSQLVLSSPTNDVKNLKNMNSALQPSTGVDFSDISTEINDNKNALAECVEDVSMYTPYHAPSFNLAAYVNKSPTLQELVKLGVNLNRLEGMRGIAEAVLKLDFEKDIKKYLLFLNELGIPPDQFGSILTKCPSILFQDFENLQIRLNYLESKKFVSSDLIRIFCKNPAWLTWRTQDIDYRLGFLQNEFHLTGDEVRHVTVKMPMLVTHKLQQIKLNIFSVREEMGFSQEESKNLLLNKPKIYTIGKSGLLSRFDYIHNVMKIPHAMIIEQPDGLLHRRSRLEARHGFLKSLSRDQYDSTKPNYISMKALISGTDAEFATNIAKSTIQTYNKFLKTL